jgi:hypothetical protein
MASLYSSGAGNPSAEIVEDSPPRHSAATFLYTTCQAKSSAAPLAFRCRRWNCFFRDNALLARWSPWDETWRRVRGIRRRWPLGSTVATHLANDREDRTSLHRAFSKSRRGGALDGALPAGRHARVYGRARWNAWARRRGAATTRMYFGAAVEAEKSARPGAKQNAVQISSLQQLQHCYPRARAAASSSAAPFRSTSKLLLRGQEPLVVSLSVAAATQGGARQGGQTGQATIIVDRARTRNLDLAIARKPYGLVLHLSVLCSGDALASRHRPVTSSPRTHTRRCPFASAA